ncbi:unnamed protein product, partial [Brassica oleracea]
REGCTDSRRHHAGLLTTADYNNLCQCENLDDIKMHLSATKYGSYLQNGATVTSAYHHNRGEVYAQACG